MAGEDVALGRQVALVGRSDLDPIGEVEGPQAEPPPERPALVGLVVGFGERHVHDRTAPDREGGHGARPGVASGAIRPRYRCYVRRFPLTVVGGRPDVGAGRRRHAGACRQRTDHERRAPRRDGLPAADPDARPRRREQQPGAAARRADQRRAGQRTDWPPTSSTPPSPRPRPPTRPTKRHGARCRTPDPTDRTPASASPATA